MGIAFLHWLVLGVLLCTAQAAERPLRIVTTFLPGFCFASNIAGDAARVENLLPGSVSLHDYQLSPADIRRLSAADLIIVNGLGMEAFLDKAVATIGKGTERKIIRLSDGLGGKLIDDAGGHNPHIWLDPKLAMHSVTNLLRALSARDPERKTIYQRNAEDYIRRLTALDRELEAALEPVRSVPFVTYHNAFPYFVRRYGLNQVGVVEQTPEVPPSPRELSKLHATIHEQKAKALFTEPAAAPRLAKQIARDAGINLAELDPIETGQLTANSYEEAMRRNAKTLVDTLRP